MTTIKAFIKRHPVLSYFALTFAISWGGILVIVGPAGILGPPEQTGTLNPLIYLAMVAGPSIAGLLLTGLVYGRAGLREFLSRMLRWRVGVRWYAIALLTAPLAMMVVLFALSPTSTAFRPSIFASDNKALLLLSGIAAGLLAGIFEELGWTGFVIPRLRLRHGVLTTGLFVGILWGMWHLLVFLGSRNSSGTVPPALYLAALLCSFLPAYRVLMVWVYDRTGSLPRGDAHARESHGQRALHPPACGDRGGSLDLLPRIGRRDVGRGRCGSRGQPRAAISTTAFEIIKEKYHAKHL